MLAEFFNQNSARRSSGRLFSGVPAQADDLRPRHHAVYYGVDHLQLLTVIYEPLAKLQKEGELGRRKITQWTRYVTVLLVSCSVHIALTLTHTRRSSMVTISRAAFIRSASDAHGRHSFIMWRASRSLSAVSATACRC